jgi:hypothetical protein
MVQLRGLREYAGRRGFTAQLDLSKPPRPLPFELPDRFVKR